ncbi:MAG TPA: VWA domain-containing protein [candidate division Zixibacteria bacterium]|nr:VWA domain-containing protein [candidate division Zixibacteria bacterium]
MVEKIIDISVMNVGEIDGRAYMNKRDMDRLGVDDFDIIQLINEFEDSCAVQVLENDEVEVDTIAVDNGILDSANISDGDRVNVRKAHIKKEAITRVKFGIEPLEGQSVEECISYILENFDELTSVIRNRPVYRNLQIDWPDAGCGHVKISFLDSDPDIDGDEVGIIDPSGKEVEVQLVPASEMSFNAVLVLDVSGSMSKPDMVVKGTGTAVEGLRRGLKGGRELESLLNEFDEKKVSRIKGAALATLLFLSQKVSRGWGEQLAILSFAGDVDVFEVEYGSAGPTPVISCTGAAKDAGLEVIADYISKRCSTGGGLTFMSGALQQAYEMTKRFEPNSITGKMNPSMVVLLTDGQPNKGNGLGINPVPIVRKCARDFPNTVLYTIGLGEADKRLLKRLSEIGRGEFYEANDLGELTKFYDLLARRFMIALKTEPTELVEEIPEDLFEESYDEEESDEVELELEEEYGGAGDDIADEIAEMDAAEDEFEDEYEEDE